MPPDLALWLTLVSLNNSCFDHILMIPKLFEPLKFNCTCILNLCMTYDRQKHAYGICIEQRLRVMMDLLVGCFGLNGPLRQYFSLYRAVFQREGERKEK